MSKRIFFGLTVLLMAANVTAQTNRMPLNRAFLQSNLDGNGKHITNAVYEGDGSGLTGVTAATALATNANVGFTTVSPDGIRNGRATTTNNTLMFGIDTPGTTTSGMMEAAAAMAKGTVQGPTAAGIEIKLAPGYLYITNPIVFSNAFTTQIKITGAGSLVSKIVYAGSNAGISCVTIQGGGNPASSIDLPMHLIIRDVGFSQINNLTNIFLRVTNYSHAEITGCNFTGWQIMTNTDWGSGMSINAPTIAGNAVGLVIGNVAEHGTFLHDNYFAGLADGFYALCDHLYATGLKFANIGFDQSLTHTTAWSTGSPFSIGAGILRRPGLNSSYGGPHFYATHIGLAVLNSGAAEDQVLHEILSEGTDFDLAAQTTNSVNFLLNAANWDGLTGVISASPYSVASGGLTVKHATYVTNGSATFPVMHSGTSGIRYWDKVALDAEVKNKLPTGSLNYNSSGAFTGGIRAFPVVDPNQGDIDAGALLDDSHGNVKLNGPGGYIIKSNTFPFNSWSYIGPCGCITWMSNATCYLVCTNSMNGTATTNKLGGL